MSEDLPALKRTRRQKPASLPAPDRLPPHSEEAEQSLLGCLLLASEEASNECFERGVTRDWFYDLRHQVIFVAMEELLDRDGKFDIITLQQLLKDQEQLEQVGGLGYLAELPDKTPSAANTEFYLDILQEKWLRRRLVRTCVAGTALAFEEDKPVIDVIATTEREVLALSEQGQGGGEVVVKETVPEVIADLEDYHRGKAQLRGLSTGLEYVDKQLCGMGGGQGNYYVIAGRPGTGKTTLALQLATHAALDFTDYRLVLGPDRQPVMETGEDGVERFKVSAHRGVPVGIFSLEMVRKTLVSRILFNRAQADAQRWRTGFAVQEDYPRLVEASKELARAPIYIDDDGTLTIESLKARARRMRRTLGIRLFVIDYVQLLTSSKARSRPDRVQELTDISREIRNLAKEMQVPWIVLAQMNRDADKEPNRAPRLSDLKDCGAIEQDADVVGFLYEPRLKAEKQQLFEQRAAQVYGQDWSRHPIRVNLLVAKNRYGPCGAPQLLFKKWCTRFMDYGKWLEEHGFKGQDQEPASTPAIEDTSEHLPTNQELGL